MALLYQLQRYKLHHVAFWMFLFLVWYYFRYQDFSTQQKALLITGIKVADLAAMVYVTNYLLIPRLIYKKHYGIFAVVFLVLIFAGSTFKLHIIGNVLAPGKFYVFDHFKTRVYDNVIPHLLLVSTGAAFKLLLDYAKAQKQIVAITREKSAAELNFLKSQINPHFIFNSLNSIYFLIDKENTEARNALHKFSDMLRFQLYELNGQKIDVQKEIGYLQDYIALQKLRKNANCEVVFDYNPEVNNCIIEPLLLIPFVENAFKHLSNYSEGQQNKVHISINLKSNTLLFKVMNTTEKITVNHTLEKQGGIGLLNVQRRLELLYPGKHQLSIEEEKEWYKIELELCL